MEFLTHPLSEMLLGLVSPAGSVVIGLLKEAIRSEFEKIGQPQVDNAPVASYCQRQRWGSAHNCSLFTALKRQDLNLLPLWNKDNPLI